MVQTVILLAAIILLVLLGWLALRPARQLPPETRPVHGEDLSTAVSGLAMRTPIRRMGRLPALRSMARLIAAMERCPARWSAVEALRQHSREMLLLLLSLRRELRRRPRLPAGDDGIPRMLLLGRELARRDVPCDADVLNEALVTWDEASATTHQERMLLPLCVRLALAEQLRGTLLSLRHELQEAQRGHQLAGRLRRARRPVALLDAAPMTPACALGLLTRLKRDGQEDLLSAAEEALTRRGLGPEEVSARHGRSQALCAEELMRCVQGLRRLSSLNWAQVEEESDPLHLLLLDDPADVYPMMTPASRLAYRAQAALLARRFAVEEARLTRGALELCRTAEPAEPMRHVGWYLLATEGRQALRCLLKARPGGLPLWLERHALTVYRAALITLDAIAGFLFLQADFSLWMLPSLLLTVGPGIRWLADALVSRLPAPPVPQLQLDSVPGDLRTLVVIPAVLHGRSEAIPAVRRLLLARHAMPEGAVDCLLLADYADSMTASSGEDSALTYAASRAIEAIDQPDSRFLYLQRSRSYDRRLHRYTGRGGQQGAMAALRQLICEGSCPDAFDAATVPAEFFHGRYAYVLMLPMDCTPAPDMLLPLLGTLTHPLNRRAVMARPRMLSDPDSLRTRMGQLHGHGTPDVLLRLTGRGEGCSCCLFDPAALARLDELFAPEQLTARVVGELGLCLQPEDSLVFRTRPAAMSLWLQQRHRQTRRAWRQLPWLFPWRMASGQLRRSPLSPASRFRLRRQLMDTLTAPSQLLTLLYAALRGSLPLFLAALALPDVRHLLPLDRHAPLRLVSRWVMLPLRSCMRLDGLWRGLWQLLFSREPRLPSPGRSDAPDTVAALEGWSQALTTAAMAGAAFLHLPPFWPGLALGAAFACFPLMHTQLDRPVRRSHPLTGDMEASLTDLAQATWRYFEETVTPESPLPPEGLQHRPARGISAFTGPGDIGLYLLSCLAAHQLELISATEMARRIARTLDGLDALPRWQGLPMARYDLRTLTPEAPARVDTESCGVLCACLLCAAQGLRAALPDTDDAFRGLAARTDRLAASMPLYRLYDPVAGLFFRGVTADTGMPEGGHCRLLATPALLTSFVAVMRHEVPPAHLDMLSRVQVRVKQDTPLCSEHGAAAEYLLPLLLLPLTPGSPMARTVDALIRAQKRQGVSGMFGASDCARWRFDGQMNYLHGRCGIPALALHALRDDRLIAPYAAALCLPFDLPGAFDSLMRLRSHGMLGRLGFYDSLDLDPSRLPEGVQEEAVQCHATAHQAMLLCALCNALTADSLVRTFMAMPAAAAASFLLRKPHAPAPTLPGRCIRRDAAIVQEPPFRREARLSTLPVDAHLIGTPEASLLLSARGMGVMRVGGVNLTRFTGDPTRVEGLQFYISDGIHAIRLGDARQEGETVFSEGCIRVTRLIHGLQCTLTAVTDPASGAFLHTLDIVNLSGDERFAEVSDCLIPGFARDGEYRVQAALPTDRAITLTRRASSPDDAPLTLCHVLTTADPLIALSAVTERSVFLGPGGTMQEPAPADAMLHAADPAPCAPCAAFRMRLSLGARGRTQLVFTTRLLRRGEAFSLENLTPRATDLPGLTTLSRLACRAVSDVLGADQARMALLSRAAGVMLWRGQPHQGAVTPLSRPLSCLRELGLDPTLPLMTALLYTSAGLELVRDAADALAWLNLSGQMAEMCVLCLGAEAAQACQAAENALAHQPCRDRIRLLSAPELTDDLRATLEAASRLLLYEGAGTFAQQLDALQLPLPASCVLRAGADSSRLPEEPLRFTHGCGGFQAQTDDPVLILQPGMAPPPWRVMARGSGLLAVDSAGGPGEIRLGAAVLSAAPGEQLYLAEGETCFSPTPLPLGQGLACRVQFSPGQTVWHTKGFQLDMTLTAAIVPGAPCCLRTLRVKNTAPRARTLQLTVAADLGDLACLTEVPGGMAAVRPDLRVSIHLMAVEGECLARRTSPARCPGLPDSAPCAPTLPGEDTGTMALLTMPLPLPADGSRSVSWILGAFSTADETETLLRRIRTGGTSVIFHQARQQWAQQLSQLSVSTPDDALNLLMNRLLPCQLRLPQPDGRRAFLAEAHRAAALLTTAPEEARAALLACAAHQYADGGVQQRWDGPADGVRTRLTGDRLLLPLMTAQYVRVTGDAAILDTPLPWLESPPLPEDTDVREETAALSSAADTLHVHCMRALTSVRLGSRGLPLTDAGEMDAGLTALRGESLWLGLIFAVALKQYAAIAPPPDQADILEVHRHLTQAIERSGWDGAWYLRAWQADGRPLGSEHTAVCRLDSVSQSWAVMALGSTERTVQAVESAWNALCDAGHDLFRRLTPPVEDQLQLGDATALCPGTGANGGQDTLAAVWMLAALCLLGQRDRAWQLLRMLNPLCRAAEPGHGDGPWLLPGGMTDRGLPMADDGSGAAGLLYSVVLTRMLGLEQHGGRIRLVPCVPEDWDMFSLTLRRGASTWHLEARADVSAVTCDGEECPGGWVDLRDDGRIHQVRAPLRRPGS